jgi:hypothetical protein
VQNVSEGFHVTLFDSPAAHDGFMSAYTLAPTKHAASVRTAATATTFFFLLMIRFPSSLGTACSLFAPLNWRGHAGTATFFRSVAIRRFGSRRDFCRYFPQLLAVALFKKVAAVIDLVAA